MARTLAITAATAAAFALATLCSGTVQSATTREVDLQIRSRALAGEVHARVVLPIGYAEHPDRRYPVVYFLHGLPAASDAYEGNDWLIDALDVAGPAILVMPQGARDADADPEYLDWGGGRNWTAFVATEFRHSVDTRFRTIPRREGRAIVGLSAGGYGAAIVGLHHLDEYSVIESWSGYFHATDPSGTRAIDHAEASAHALVPQLRRTLRIKPTLVAFYIGRGDTRFLAENRAFNAELSRAGVAHHFAVYRGDHDSTLWQRHAHAWLAMALARLAPAEP